MAKKKKKHISAKHRKIRKIILLTLLTVFLGGLIYLSPKIIKVYKMYKEAKVYVKNCSKSTFMDAKTTIIYDGNGDQLCTMKSEKDLYYVSFKDIPKDLAQAFVVTEDRSFYKHSGIDYKAIVRAIVENQKNNQVSQGASTITQQLAKNVFLTQEVTWERKIEEMFISVELEKKFTKEQILEFYLNNIYFGNGYYGVEAAARGYFNKSVSDLSLSEQAFIAAIPNNPSKYNPLTKFDNTIERRDRILDQLYDADDISSMKYNSAKTEQIVLNPKENEEINSSVVTYVRHCATESLMSSMGFSFRYNFTDESDYNSYQDSYDAYYTDCQQKLLGGGYSVYTSINMTIQDELQSSIDKNLAGFKSTSSEGVYDMQGAATCIDNSTGNVVAIVGSRSQDDIKGLGLNRAYQSYRQPGSSIKPLSVYTPYLQLGKTPDTVVTDEAIEGGPNNADKTYAGQMTLRDAVRFSKNTVAWKVYQEVTPKGGSAFLLRMGFHKIWMDKEYVAAALGGFTYGVTTEEMAGGYAAIVNDGTYRKPTCVQKITNSSGKTLIDETNRGIRVYEVNASRMMTDMLHSVVTDGTGKAANVQNAIVAGKTGTTNSTKDIWFCGFSKYYTTSVWVGYDYPKELNGSSAYANTIFRDFMTSVHEGLAIQEFPSYTNNNSKQQSTQQEETKPSEPETESDTVQPESTTQETTGVTSVTQPTTKGNTASTGANNNTTTAAASPTNQQQTTSPNSTFPQTDQPADPSIRGEW